MGRPHSRRANAAARRTDPRANAELYPVTLTHTNPSPLLASSMTIDPTKPRIQLETAHRYTHVALCRKRRVGRCGRNRCGNRGRPRLRNLPLLLYLPAGGGAEPVRPSELDVSGTWAPGPHRAAG